MVAFNMSKFRLEDLEYYCDKRLDDVNVYSIVLVSNSVDFDLIVTDFCQSMKKYSLVQMIQQISDDFVRFTFVSHICCFSFSKCVSKLIDRLQSVYKCKLSVL